MRSPSLKVVPKYPIPIKAETTVPANSHRMEREHGQGPKSITAHYNSHSEYGIAFTKILV